jgi:hypothetical protein
LILLLISPSQFKENVFEMQFERLWAVSRRLSKMDVFGHCHVAKEQGLVLPTIGFQVVDRYLKVLLLTEDLRKRYSRGIDETEDFSVSVTSTTKRH